MSKIEYPLKYPYWAYPSRKAYLRAKRHDVSVLSGALDKFTRGSAWLPGYPEIAHAARKLEADLKELAKTLRHA